MGFCRSKEKKVVSNKTGMTSAPRILIAGASTTRPLLSVNLMTSHHHTTLASSLGSNVTMPTGKKMRGAAIVDPPDTTSKTAQKVNHKLYRF